MNGRQIRAARELLQLTQAELADLSGVSRPTLRDIESEFGDPRRSSMDKVVKILQDRGIKFSDAVGIVGIPPE